MLGPVPDLHLKAGFRQFSASPSRNREPWWVRDSLSLQQNGKKGTRWRSTCPRVHPSKDPTNIQLCANKRRVGELVWCQWCNPGSHRKRDWNMMRLNSPSLTFLFLYYIIYIIYTVLFYSQILDKCDHPKLSKPLVYLHSKFPVTTWTSNFCRSILCSRRRSQNIFKKAFPGNEARPPTYQISQKRTQKHLTLV